MKRFRTSRVHPMTAGDRVQRVTMSNNGNWERSNAVLLETTPLGAIGRALQTHYGELLREPLPPRFEALLARIEAEETRISAGERRSPEAAKRRGPDGES
jgi:hypothetical protein